MKKITKSELHRIGGRVFAVGYHKAAILLGGVETYAHNEGAFGWNWDAYIPANNIAICTGYRNLTGIDANEITAPYEKQARAINETCGMSWKEKDKRIEAIRDAWLDALRAL